MKIPVLFIVVPCYNEEAVLPITAPLFLDKLNQLSSEGKISPDSRVLFIDDGSKDATWQIILKLSKQDCHFTGIRQSRNRGHQNAVLAGMMEAKDICDITISIDCDGQDDINAVDEMLKTPLPAAPAPAVKEIRTRMSALAVRYEGPTDEVSGEIAELMSLFNGTRVKVKLSVEVVE